jgi:GrpB-like predicted nucleotidyltransferase (UPF0157 family)
MDEIESLKKAINEKIIIVPYNSCWSSMFEEEKIRLLQLFPDTFVCIEHFGSTAVPGLSAKPIIDIMAGVESMQQADELLEPLCGVDYTTSPEFNHSLTDRRWLMKHKNGRRTHHLHLMVYGCEGWNRHLSFRDKLRSSDELKKFYENQKRRWAREHQSDRESYTGAKDKFIKSTLNVSDNC